MPSSGNPISAIAKKNAGDYILQVKRNQTAIENSNLIAKFAIAMLDQEKTHLKQQKSFAEDAYREF